MMSNGALKITLSRNGEDLYPFEVREAIARERKGLRPQGAWRKWGDKVTFTTANHNAAVDVQRLAIRLGYIVEVSEVPPKPVKTRRDT